jgi:hypothetical protein
VGLWRKVWVWATCVGALACAQTATAQVTERLPDLVADAPDNTQLQTFAQPDGNHLLLRFNGYIHNAGQGAFEMRGSDRVNDEMTTVVQRVYRSDGSFIDDSSLDPRIIFEPADGHDHWHLKDIGRYSLWNEAKTAEVAPAMKTGFCLIDSQRRETNGPTSPVYDTNDNNFCGQGEPTLTSLFEGVSAGWRDIYDRTLTFQWVDASDVNPGNYYLRADIDPDGVVRESNEVNSGTFRSSTSQIPGYSANPVNAGTVSASGPTSIALSTTSFGSGLGTRTFRIIEPPKHGWVNPVPGPTFTNTSVVYTPFPGWRGPDRFTYTVQQSTSSFPRYPTAAAVTLNVGGVFPNVAISGAPSTLLAGTSARLLATVLGEDPLVNWTVDGVGGGTPTTGTVDATGLYVAPSTAPPGGQVTVRATTASGAFAEVTMQIQDPPAPQPAPALTATVNAAVESSPERTLRAMRGARISAVGNALVVSARPDRVGVMRVRVRDSENMLGKCRARVVRSRTFVCRTPLPVGVIPSDLTVAMTLRVRGKLVEVRRFGVSAKADGGLLHAHP